MPLLTTLHQVLPGWALHVGKLALWLVFLTAVFVPLERLFALHPSRWLRRQYRVDLGYYFLNSLLPAALLAVPVAAMVALGQSVMPAALRAALQGLPWWVMVPLALVLADVGAYWGHRLSHEVPLLWRFHALHHSAEHIDFMANTRAHPVDMVVVRLFGLAPLCLLGAGDGAAATLPAAIVTIFGAILGFFVHANVRWRLGVLEWLVATPAFHHWHHSRTDHVDHNYAATFPWIDRLFGTLHLPAGRWPEAYGLEHALPSTMAGQLLSPLAHHSAAPQRAH